MEPPTAKRININAPQALTPLEVIQLPDDILGYISRFIVKYPALHLFFPVSRKLAQCALKVFADFANEGGALSFYSSDPDKVVRFALTHCPSKLNLSNLTVIAPHLDDLLVGNPSVTKLCAPYPSWTERAHSALSKLIALSVKNYASAEVLELENNQPWNNLTRLELCATRVYGQTISMPKLATMPKLKELKLTYVALPNDLPLQIARLPDLATLSLLYCSDGANAEEAPDRYYKNFAKTSTGLTSLSLDRDSLVAWNFRKILSVLTNLQVLYLEQSANDDAIDDDQDDESMILECVVRFTQLKTLSLIDFRFDEQIIEALNMATGLRNLTISLRYSYTDSESGFNKAPEKKELFTKIEALTALESLDLSSQALDLTHFRSMGRLTNLRSLSLCGIRGITLEKIRMLTSLTHLATLALEGSLRNGQQKAFQPLLRMPKLSKLKVLKNDDIAMLSMGILSNLTTLIMHENEPYGFEKDFPLDREVVLNQLSTFPKLRTLYFGIKCEEISAIDLLTKKLTNLQKLMISPHLLPRDESSLQGIRKLLKSKKIRFVES